MKVAARILAALAALTLAGAAMAQTPAGYPNKPVRVIVPFAPGGPTDVIGRMFAQKLSERMGQQFYVENIPGAGGNIGNAAGAKAPADGYTILVVNTGFMVNPSLYAKVPYDPVKDFTPVTLVAVSPNILFVHPSVPATTVKELIDLIKSSPGKYSYAHASIGSTPHLSGELLKLTFGLDLVTVPFTSAGLAINSTLGGHTPIGITALPPAVANIKDGKLRGLAVMAVKRVAALPNVPTLAEAGVPDQEADTLTGIVMPAGTSNEIVGRLNREIVRIGKLPEMQERMLAIGFIPVLDTPDEFGIRIKSEMAKWGKVVHNAKLRIE
jgi:tripartite-type tricarboxylate transporter receptor subunit TctC